MKIVANIFGIYRVLHISLCSKNAIDMKTTTQVKCIKDYDGLYVGESVTAVYGKDRVWYIASKRITHKKLKEHFEIVNE